MVGAAANAEGIVSPVMPGRRRISKSNVRCLVPDAADIGEHFGRVKKATVSSLIDELKRS